MGQKKLVRKAEPPSKRGIAWPRWTGFREMSLRSWLELLVVPLALVVIGFLFSVQQDARQQRIEDQRAQQAQRIENQRSEAERDLAEQRAQDEALQAYLNQMSSLLLERDLRNSEVDSEVSTLARARTVTVLQRLDANRNQTVIRFLNEARLTGSAIGLLVEADLQGSHLEGTDLRDADLSGANLRGADLHGADLSGAELKDADLNFASISGANMSGTYLDGANLRNTDSIKADLSGSALSGAKLSGAFLREADLRETYLGETDLSDTDLSGAKLSDAIIRGANLRDAKGVTGEQLEEQAKILGNTTMPNGQKYEDWLKARDKRQQDE